MKYYSRDVFGNIKFQSELKKNESNIFMNVSLDIFNDYSCEMFKNIPTKNPKTGEWFFVFNIQNYEATNFSISLN